MININSNSVTCVSSHDTCWGQHSCRVGAVASPASVVMTRVGVSTVAGLVQLSPESVVMTRVGVSTVAGLVQLCHLRQ